METTVSNTKPFKKQMRIIAVAVGITWVIGGLAIGIYALTNRAAVSSVLHPSILAPKFRLQDQTGKWHKMEDYNGRPVALAFLPDLERASQTELSSLSASIRSFDTMGVKVFGISAQPSHIAKPIHDSLSLEFPILTDPNNGLARQYGIDPNEEHKGRVSFVIGANGKILLPVIDVEADRHGEQVVGLTECCFDSTFLPGSKMIGLKVDDFRLPSVTTGQLVSLYGDKSQKATVLFVMSAECPCSAKYNSRFNDLASEFSSKGVRFVGINSSYHENLKQIADYVTREKFLFPVVKDTDNIVADKIDAKVTPEAFVFDSKGTMRYHGRIDDSRQIAMVRKHSLHDALTAVLDGSAPLKSEEALFGCAIDRK